MSVTIRMILANKDRSITLDVHSAVETTGSGSGSDPVKARSDYTLTSTDSGGSPKVEVHREVLHSTMEEWVNGGYIPAVEFARRHHPIGWPGGLADVLQFEVLTNGGPKDLMPYVAGGATEVLIQWKGLANRVVNEIALAPAAPAPAAPAAPAAPVEPTSPVRPDSGPERFFRPGGEEYFPKWAEAFQDWDVNVLRRVQRANAAGRTINVLLHGEPGAGKTALLEAAFGQGIQEIEGSPELDSRAIVAEPLIENGSTGYRPGPLVAALTHRHGPDCPNPCGGNIFFFEEANLARPDALGAVQMVADGRKEFHTPEFGVIEVPDDFLIVMAINPNAGLPLLPAVMSRMTLKIEVTQDYRTAARLGVDDEIVAWAESLAAQAAAGVPVGQLPSIRDLIAYRDLAEEFGKVVATSNLLAAADEGSSAIWQETMESRGLLVVPMKL